MEKDRFREGGTNERTILMYLGETGYEDVNEIKLP